MGLNVYLYAAPTASDREFLGTVADWLEDQGNVMCERVREIIFKMEVSPNPPVYEGGTTHNLGRMASAAGIYSCLWRPEELGITRASELIGPLESGLSHLRKYPNEMMALAPSNGWGTYEGLIEFVQEYLNKCREYPHAEIVVSR